MSNVISLSVMLTDVSYVAGDVPGTVTVEITTNDGDYLGKTEFTYVNQDEEAMKRIVQSRTLQGQFFKMWSKQYEKNESEEINTQTFGEFKHFPLSLVTSAYRRIFVYSISFIRIGHTVFNGATKT